MWPFGPRRVVVKVAGLSELAASIRYAARKDAEARRYEARLRRPDIVRPKPPKVETDTPEWAAWEQAHPELPDEERLHARWAYDIVRGAHKVTDEDRLEAIIVYQKMQSAYDLPALDGRAMMNGHAKE